MKIKTACLAGLLCLATSFSIGAFAQKPALRFKADKTFKIVQFTDLQCAADIGGSEGALRHGVWQPR